MDTQTLVSLVVFALAVFGAVMIMGKLDKEKHTH